MRTKAASGGSYFIDIASWIPDLNHILIANQPTPPSFYFWHHAPLSLSLSLRVSQPPLSPLCIVSRNYSRKGSSSNFGRPFFDIFPIASVRKPSFSCSRVLQYIYIYLLSGLLCTDYVPRISYLFIYFSSFRSLSLFRRLARANRSFLSFLLSRDDSIT